MTLKELFAFNNLLLQFQKVERVVRVPGSERWENDFEHSYQMAMVAWYIVERDKLPFDKDKIIKYALIHDFVEVYAGDTYLYGSKDELASKIEREEAAAERLRKEFSDFKDLHTLVEQYESGEDREARFVRALDKIIPTLNIYADGGRTWREKDIILEMLIEKNEHIIKKVPELEPYFKEIVALLEGEPELLARK